MSDWQALDDWYGMSAAWEYMRGSGAPGVYDLRHYALNAIELGERAALALYGLPGRN